MVWDADEPPKADKINLHKVDCKQILNKSESLENMKFNLAKKIQIKYFLKQNAHKQLNPWLDIKGNKSSKNERNTLIILVYQANRARHDVSHDANHFA